MKIYLTQISQPWTQAMEKPTHIYTFQNNRSADMPLLHQRSEYRSPTVCLLIAKQREGHYKADISKDKRLANQ